MRSRCDLSREYIKLQEMDVFLVNDEVSQCSCEENNNSTFSAACLMAKGAC